LLIQVTSLSSKLAMEVKMITTGIFILFVVTFIQICL
jgi:hypothetical protein